MTDEVSKMGEIIKRETQTMQELDAEIAAEEKALSTPVETPPAPQADVVPQATATQTPEQTEVPAPAPEVVETPKASEELETLRAQLNEVNARNAELTKRIRDEDGRRGGEMGKLQSQVENLSNQLRDLVEENRRLAQAKPNVAEPQHPSTPEDEPLAKYDADVREGVEKIVKRQNKDVSDAVSKAEKIAEEARQSAYMARYERMMDKIRTAIPNFDEINANADFVRWTEGRMPGSPNPRKATLESCAQSCNPEPVIELASLWLSEQKAAQVPAAEPKGPTKPSKDAQVQIPSAATPPNPTPSKPKTDIAVRIKMLEDKVYRLRNHTPAESKELDALYEQFEREKASQAA